MAQNRPPPCFQEYAASMLANAQFRRMPLHARGLLYTLRLECWENHRMPAEPKEMSAVIRFNEEEVGSAMQWLDSFFVANDGSLTSPDLEDYRKHLVDKKAAQSKGVKKGAAITNAGKTRVSCESVVKLSTDQLSSVQKNSVINERDSLEESWSKFSKD